MTNVNGRDLTAQDVVDAIDEWTISEVHLHKIADFLNRIARPSDTDEPLPPHCLSCGLTTGYLESERDFLREELEKAAAELARLRARVAELEAASPDDAHTTTETTTQYVVMATRPNGESQRVAYEGRDRAIEIADSFDPPEGWGPAWVECIRTVSTTTHNTAWKADER